MLENGADFLLGIRTSRNRNPPGIATSPGCLVLRRLASPGRTEMLRPDAKSSHTSRG
jgi:hypothetical protein